MMKLQEALDVWSLGVMAFELLTGTGALPMNEGSERVRICEWLSFEAILWGR